MTAAQRKKLYEALLALSRDLATKGPKRIEPNRSSMGEVGTAEDEQPLNEMHQAIASNRNKNLTGVLTRVEKALAKLREVPDEYGECEDCQEEIALPRLQAMPYAELCVRCQAKKDAPKAGAGRKHLTDYRD